MWSPSEDEVAHAREVIAAFDEALAAGKGVVVAMTLEEIRVLLDARDAPQAGCHEVNALIDGKDPVVKETKAIGCGIKWKKAN